MERKNKPSAIPTSPSLPQPTVDKSDTSVTARLPNSADSVTIYLYGATITSWTANNSEQIFLSTTAKLDGSKPIRGGIPLVFPVFGPPPPNHATSSLPQHGFARNNHWEFMGSSSSESTSRKADDSVKLDFGLSSGMLDEATRKQWGYDFALVFSVTLGKGTLETGMHVQNKGDSSFDFQCLFHSYLRVKDISKTTISGLAASPYIDKVRSAQKFTESSSQLKISSETDRVYTPPTASDGSSKPISILEDGREKLTITRDALPNVTVWNLWGEKAKGMSDFGPKDGYKQFVAIEPGSVLQWVKLEAGDAWEGSQYLEAKL